MIFLRKKIKWNKFKLPTSLTMLFFVTSFIIIISWIPGITCDYPDKVIVPVTGDSVEVVVNGRPAGVFDLFLAPLKGFSEKLDTIIFIIVLGGFLNVVIKSEALDAGIKLFVSRMEGKGGKIWILMLILIFSIGGTTFGLGEETIAFYPILIPVMLSAGFDVITSVMIILLGAGIGCLGSFLNPFVIGVSFTSTDTNIYGITSSSGIVWRVVSWFILTVTTIVFVILYAACVKKNPEKSFFYKDRDFYLESFGVSEQIPEFTKRRKVILLIFALTFLLMVFSLISWSSFGYYGTVWLNNWIQLNAPYIASFFVPFGDFTLLLVAVIFLVSSIVIGFIDWKGEEKFIQTFLSGASNILSVCIVIAMAGGIGWIMKNTGMQYKIVGEIKNLLGKLGRTWFIIVVFFFFLIISIIIPSTSGFAVSVMPVLGPIAEGINPGLWSGTITAFSFASGFTNLISPTSYILMAALNISKVSWYKYGKVIWPYLLILFILLNILLFLGSLLPISRGGVWF